MSTQKRTVLKLSSSSPRAPSTLAPVVVRLGARSSLFHSASGICLFH